MISSGDVCSVSEKLRDVRKHLYPMATSEAFHVRIHCLSHFGLFLFNLTGENERVRRSSVVRHIQLGLTLETA